MEGELVFLSPPRPSRVSFEGRVGCGFGSSTWASPPGTLISPASCGGNGPSGFSSPTWGSPLKTLFNSPSSCVSDEHAGGNVSGLSTATWGSTLETLFNSHSSPVSDSRGSGSRSVFSTPKMALPLGINSPSSFISDSRGGGNGFGSSTPKQASQLEPLLNLLSSPVSDSRGCGNTSSPRISKEKDSELMQKAESLLRAITERCDHCFLRLRDATAGLDDLRRERVRLGAENLRLSILLGELGAAEQSKKASAVALPLPPKAEQAEAASTPKSISIRSKGFLSKNQPQGVATPQRLRVQATEDAGKNEKDDGDVEVEAFRQGAVKTELCNKWKHGACPYDGRCRFAHGMEELRPVIRHPRYKTLTCQLFAAASGCPYGHRCHFRHALAPTAGSC